MLLPRAHACGTSRSPSPRRIRFPGQPATHVTEIGVPPSGDVTTSGTDARQNPSPGPGPDHDRIDLEAG
ncbi:MAG TPA: hypothetical protein VJ370_06015 [Streptosporangiaceae bacterium]|nr:hypothetical protein [Streptosporangiaceae bacterium]